MIVRPCTYLCIANGSDAGGAVASAAVGTASTSSRFSLIVPANLSPSDGSSSRGCICTLPRKSSTASLQRNHPCRRRSSCSLRLQACTLQTAQARSSGLQGRRHHIISQTTNDIPAEQSSQPAARQDGRQTQPAPEKRRCNALLHPCRPTCRADPRWPLAISTRRSCSLASRGSSQRRIAPWNSSRTTGQAGSASHGRCQFTTEQAGKASERPAGAAAAVSWPSCLPHQPD